MRRVRGGMALALPLAVFGLVFAGVETQTTSAGGGGNPEAIAGRAQVGGILAFGGGRRRVSMRYRRDRSDADEPRYVEAMSSDRLKYLDVSRTDTDRTPRRKHREITIAKSSVRYDKVRLGEKKPGWKYLTAAVRRQIDAADIERGRWRYIVVHESATAMGNARAFDRYHREVKGMPNGLAYHFVIGNGSYSGNGQIEIGNRWTDQIKGGHLKSSAQNEIALGICLVGDFDRHKVSRTQMEALDELITYLQAKVGKAIVTTHRRINVSPTSCPGRYFPDAMVMTAFNR